MNVILDAAIEAGAGGLTLAAIGLLVYGLTRLNERNRHRDRDKYQRIAQGLADWRARPPVRLPDVESA